MQPIDWASELDRQREPLKRLARALLRDAHAAEDVVQDAFAAVLARERRPDGVASWLRAVVRKLALDRKRRSARRDARESSAARREGVDGEDSLARLEVVEALAREVRELDEPYRTALRLRYFEGRTPREIARTLDVPLATIESRLVRALERLRERLDRRGGREKWLAATAAWIHPMEVPWMELAIVKTVTKFGVAAAVLLVAWWSWNAWSSSTGSTANDPSASAPLEAPKETLASAELSSSHPQRAEVVAPSAEPATPESAPSTKLAGLVLDAAGKPVAGVEVGFVADGESEVRAAPRATSDADGRFQIDEPASSGSLRAVSDAWFTLGAPPIGPLALPCDRIVCIAPRLPLEGVVVDRDGKPLEGARISIVGDPRSLWLPVPANDVLRFARSTVSDRDGHYRIEDAPDARRIWVHATRPGTWIEKQEELGSLRYEDGRIVLEDGNERALTLRGRVVDRRGRPLAGAHVFIGPREHLFEGPVGGIDVQARTDVDGAFELPVYPQQSDLVLTAIAKGLQSSSLSPLGDPTVADSWPDPLELRLENDVLSIQGRVVDTSGKPLGDAWVNVLDRQHLWLIKRTDDPLEPSSGGSVEELTAEHGPREHIPVDADGRFEVSGLQQRTYRFVAFDARTLAWTVSEPIDAGATEVELVIDVGQARTRVAGRVVDCRGEPIARARVNVVAEVPTAIGSDGKQALGSGASVVAVTDDLGRFEFRGLSNTATCVFVDGPSARWFGGYRFLSEAADSGEVEIVLPRVTFVQVELSPGALPDGVQPNDVLAVDARNMWVESHIAGRAADSYFRGSNRTGIFPVGDTARFLIVRSQAETVLRIPVELEAGKVNVIRR